MIYLIVVLMALGWHIFADDCEMHIAGEPLRDNSCSSLLNLENWAANWQLAVAKEKCFHLSVSSSLFPGYRFYFSGVEICKTRSNSDMAIS